MSSSIFFTLEIIIFCSATAHQVQLHHPNTASCRGPNNAPLTQHQMSYNSASCNPELPQYWICPESTNANYTLHLFVPIDSPPPHSVTVFSNYQNPLPNVRWEFVNWQGVDTNCSIPMLHAAVPLPKHPYMSPTIYLNLTCDAVGVSTVYRISVQCGRRYKPWFPEPFGRQKLEWIAWIGYKMTTALLTHENRSRLEINQFVAFVTDPVYNRDREQLILAVNVGKKFTELKPDCKDGWCRFSIIGSNFTTIIGNTSATDPILNASYAFLFPRSYRRNRWVRFWIDEYSRTKSPDTIPRIQKKTFHFGAIFAVCATVCLAILAIFAFQFKTRRLSRTWHEDEAIDIEASMDSGNVLSDERQPTCFATSGSFLVTKPALRDQLPLWIRSGARWMRLLRLARSFSPRRVREIRDGPLVLLLDQATVDQNRQLLNRMMSCEKHRPVCLLVAESGGRLRREDVGPRETWPPAPVLAQEVLRLASRNGTGCLNC